MSMKNGKISREHLEKLLRHARAAEVRATEAHDRVFKYIEKFGIDLDIPGDFCNSDNLADAITCYIHYDEEDAAKLAGIVAGEVAL